jgi:tetratricopeptide (TPR) repeat protein
MTVTIDEPQADLPWRRDQRIWWQPRSGGFVLCSVGHDALDCIRAEPRASGGHPLGRVRRLVIPPPTPGFDNLAGFDALLSVLLPLVRAESPELLSAHAAVIDLLTNPGDRHELGRLVPISEAAALGTTRRVSRESHTAALWLDDAARLVASAAAALGGDRATLLDVRSIDLWDRPSLRILFRAVIHAGEAPARLWSVGQVRHYRLDGASLAPFSTEETAATITSLRTIFLRGLGGRRAGRLHLGGTPVDPSLAASPSAAPLLAPPSFAEPPVADLSSLIEAARARGPKSLLRLIGDALALQNFERVELLIDTAWAGSDQPTRAHLMRLSAISRAQVGEIAAADVRLGEAISVATRPEDVAHLHYLRGLIATKRHYDLAAATKEYAAAKAVLDATAEPSPDALVEGAWVHNGLGLAAAMRARESSSEQERERHYAEAFEHEFAAFATVRDVPGSSAFYLRYNLGYNLSFLLEITGRYREAEAFLTSVSAVLLAANRADFGALYKYAIGILQSKAGESDAAAATLGEAVDLAYHLRDPFYLEKLFVAIAYVEHHRGAHAAAAQRFREGVMLARWLRDEDAYAQHLAGLLWSIALGGLPYPADVAQAAAQWYPTVAQVFGTTDDAWLRADALNEAHAQIPVPSSKLPSYIPSVDLEGTPGRDLNRYLTGVGVTEAPAAPATGQRRAGSVPNGSGGTNE